MDTLIILVALATITVPTLAEVAAHVFAAGEPTRGRDALRCC
jgi:hypothetical protein